MPAQHDLADCSPAPDLRITTTRWQCRASAVITALLRSRPSSSGIIIGISFVLALIAAWAATTPCWPARAASRWTWLPSAAFAPRTALPSTLTWTSGGSSATSDGGVLPRSGSCAGASQARPISHAPAAASTALASAPVTTRQIADFDGGPGGLSCAAVLAPQRSYRPSARVRTTKCKVALRDCSNLMWSRAGPCECRQTIVCRHCEVWVPKTCASWPDAPLTVGCSARCLPRRGTIFGLWG